MMEQALRVAKLEVRLAAKIREEQRMTVGRPAGVKTCDDCRQEYSGPAYYTFVGSECTTVSPEVGRVAPHLDCTENLCPRCAGPYLEPDRPGDPRRRQETPR